MLQRRPVRFAVLSILQALCLTVGFAGSSSAQGHKVWFLAEGAANAFFEEEILIGNPNATAATVNIELLPESNGAPVTPITRQITVPATSRYTFRVNDVQELTADAVGARITSDLDIVVERSMYWAYGQRRGGHNAEGVVETAGTWYLAEGASGFFEAFVLISNTSATTAATVEVRFLFEAGAPLLKQFTVPASGRLTVYTKDTTRFTSAELMRFDTPFSVEVRQQGGGQSIVVERAMYWNGYEGGHGATAVTAASESWFFAEGAQGGSASLTYHTYILLANPSASPATVDVTFLRDLAPPVTRQIALPANSRRTVDTSTVPELKDTSFATRISSPGIPILAERAMYWTSSGVTFIDGHSTAGVTAEASKWAFAEGRQGRLTANDLSFDSFFLFANTSTNPVRIRGTFVRPDGRGYVQTFSVAASSRFTLLASSIPELANQRFAAFFEAVDANGAPTTQTFVAERSVYWGPGYYGGHASTGTPWTGTIAAPPIVDLTPAITSVTPGQGPISGGTDVTIKGANLFPNTVIEFGDRAAVTQWIDPTTLVARAPSGAAVGLVGVSAINPGRPATTLPNAFRYEAVVPLLSVTSMLGFGDSITFGRTKTRCDAGGTIILCDGSTTPWSPRTRDLLAARYPNQSFTQSYAGVPGECASHTGCSGTSTSGRERLPTMLTSSQDVVVILEGVNDLNTGFPIGTIIDSLRTMIQTVKSSGKQAVICRLTPFRAREDNGFIPVDATRWNQLNAAIDALATEQGIGRVDLPTYLADVNRYISPDGLHPTPAGYQRIADAVRDKLVERYEIRP